MTSLDVARRAGVSRTTVSFVLNDVPGMQISAETRQRVLEAAQALGYVPDATAQALASGRSKTVGLLLARRPNAVASDMFLTQVIEVLVREINRQGMRLLLEVAEAYDNSQAYLNLVRSNRIDGILYSGPRLDDVALGGLYEHHIPTVLMGALPGSPFCSVDIDNQAAARRAVEHLVGLGHTCIACITNAEPAYQAAADRLSGYQAALRAAGIAYEPSLVRYGDFDPQSGYEQAKSLLEGRIRPTAIFVASDVVALGAAAAVRESGLCIPQEMALVGFDDLPLARFIEPGLTSVRVPVAELSLRALEMLVGLIRDKTPEPAQALYDTSLVIRQSCGGAGRTI